MKGSLYWKICATFLVVVFGSLVAGSTVFSWISNRLLSDLRRDSMLAFARLGLHEVQRYLEAGGAPAQLPAHLEGVFREFPLLSILHADTDGTIRGKEEPGRPELRRLLGETRASRVGPAGHRIVYLGPGRGVAVLMPVSGGARGWVLLAGRGAVEDVAPALITAGAAALVVVFLVAAVLGLIVFRLVVRRLGELRRCLAGVAEGDLNRRVPAPGPDEIGDLGRSFNAMAERLARSVDELAQIDARRRRFLADISHELKTPLTALRGQLERLLGGAGSVQVAWEEVDRIGILIEDLLELARLDSTEFSLKRDEVVLQRLASRAAERFKVALENRKVSLAMRLSPEPVRRTGDERRLEQVLANLVSNALASLPDGGRIELVVEERQGRAVLEVADDGPGLSAAQFAHPTGLGLNIIKRLVEAHRGTIAMEAGLDGRGTRAIVTLP